MPYCADAVWTHSSPNRFSSTIHWNKASLRDPMPMPCSSRMVQNESIKNMYSACAYTVWLLYLRTRSHTGDANASTTAGHDARRRHTAGLRP